MTPRRPSWARRAWASVKRYVKTDLREIVLPRGLDYPPGYKPPPEDRRLSAREFWEAVKEASREYWKTWQPAQPEAPKAQAPEESPIVQEVADVAKQGAQNLRPLLQDLYYSRARAYRDAIREFVLGYREGLAAVDKKGEGEERGEEAGGEGGQGRGETAAGPQRFGLGGPEAEGPGLGKAAAGTPQTPRGDNAEHGARAVRSSGEEAGLGLGTGAHEQGVQRAVQEAEGPGVPAAGAPAAPSEGSSAPVGPSSRPALGQVAVGERGRRRGRRRRSR